MIIVLCKEMSVATPGVHEGVFMWRVTLCWLLFGFLLVMRRNDHVRAALDISCQHLNESEMMGTYLFVSRLSEC